MTDQNITKVAILIEFDNGNAHQVLSRKEHKLLAIKFIAGLDDGLKVSEQVEPFLIETLKK